MAQVLPDAVVAAAYEWTLRDPRAKTERTFEQTELSIEGEARLIGVGQRLAVVLSNAGYVWADFEAMLEENSNDWSSIGKMVVTVAEAAPELVAQTVAIFFAVYPTDEDGNENPSYNDDLRFFRRSVNIARFVDMLRIFVAQNDYQRMLRPFSTTLADGMANMFGRPVGEGDEAASPEPSEGLQVVSGDGSSLVDLMPSESETPTQSGEPTESDSATSSEESPTS